MYKFKNLVFEGGGVKGIAYGGALQKLDEFGIISQIERVAGTSAGAITATLLAIGYTASQVSDILAETDFSVFPDTGLDIFYGSKRLLKNYGWHRGNEFESWLEKHIEARTGKNDLTFLELHNLKQQDKTNTHRELYVVGSNLSRQMAEIFCYETTPHMEIRKAVRISMSIPFYFQCVRSGGDILVDGGLTLNYPIALFDHERYLFDPENYEKLEYSSKDRTIFNHETLGMKLNGINSKRAYQKIDNLLDYTNSIVNLINQTARDAYIHRNDWKRTIYIDASIVSPTDFDASTDKIKVSTLIENGKNNAEKYLLWKAENEKNKISNKSIFNLYGSKLKLSWTKFLNSKLKQNNLYLKNKSKSEISNNLSKSEVEFEDLLIRHSKTNENINFSIGKFKDSLIEVMVEFNKTDHTTELTDLIAHTVNICSWQLASNTAKSFDKNANIRLGKSSAKYLLPIERNFTAVCSLKSEKKINKLHSSYAKWGKTELELEVDIKTELGTAAKFTVLYAISR